MDILLYGLAFIIMFSIGISLKTDDFLKILQNPRNLLIGLITQIVLPPLLVILIIFNFPIEPQIKIGFLILSVSPGGHVSNYLNYFFNCNVPLCLSITVINTFIIPISIPLILNYFLKTVLPTNPNLEISFSKFIIEIIFISSIPILAGIILSKLMPRIRKTEKILKPITSILFSLVLAISLLRNASGGSRFFVSETVITIAIALSLNIFLMIIGYSLIKTNLRDARTIGVEIGIHNTPMALIIVNVLNVPTAALPIIFYALFTLWTAILFLFITGKYNKGVMKNPVDAATK
jgi:BASS family bile acid:Na+ symporter